MTVSDSESIDFVVLDAQSDEVHLVMVEHRPWGDSGACIPDLKLKFETYLTYALDGQLAEEHPAMASKRIRFELRTCYPCGAAEERFLEEVVSGYLEPQGIAFSQKRIELE